MTKSGSVVEAPLRIACIQLEPAVGKKRANLARSEPMIGEAAAAGAELVLLPELANSGYTFAAREEAFWVCEPVPDGESRDLWEKLARSLNMTIVAGICEYDSGAFYNSAGRSGRADTSEPIGRYIRDSHWECPGRNLKCRS